MVSEIAKETMDSMATQLISFILTIGIADAVPYILLSLVRVPRWLKNIVSVVVMLIAMSYSFTGILLN